MNNIFKILTSWQVIVLLIFLAFNILAINFQPLNDGAAIRSVDAGSAAYEAGIEGVDASTRPMNREVIHAVNGVSISSAQEYYEEVSKATVGETVVIKTTDKTYSLTLQPNILYDNETNESIVNGTADLGLLVYDAPTSNLRKGLDLQGGTRVIVTPVDDITPEEYDAIRANLEQRLNVFGLSDVSITVVDNFQFQPEYILIEIAGNTVEEISDLVLSQGQFRATIGNKTVFTGEAGDIIYVGKGPQESRIEACFDDGAGEVCRFSFVIRLTTEAAQRQAEITRDLSVVPGTSYLNETLDLYLDGVLISDLQISSGLRGQATTEISISGSGYGINRQAAIENATQEKNKLQTVIETGSLPSKLQIVKADTISASLGKNFASNALLVGVLAILAVCIILYVRYRDLNIIIPMGLALFAEVIILLGSAVFINWTLDLAAIAGIIIAVGTGVDHMIVITDEALKKQKSAYESWKAKFKRAFGIVFGAYLTTFCAMLPLLVAGAGLLKGFAITTILGLSFGVFLVRPTYAKVLEILKN